jgi:uncharacterized membrane protein (DUF2068 family)
MNTDRGVRAIILYKTVKAVAELVGGALLALLLVFHETGGLHETAAAIRHHVTAGWAVKLADLITAGTSHHAIVLTVVALTADGLLTGVEGWALQRNHWWGPWLVVAASGVLLPVELRELVRHPRAGHVLILVLNVAMVIYLARKALHEHELRKKLKPLP